MNQLSPVRHRLSEIQLSEVRSSLAQEVGHEELLLMVEKNQEAALMGVQPKDPARAAQLCFDKVDSHFGAISALLGNDQVFDEVAQTLRQMKESKDPGDERKAVAVALAALASGQAMDVNSEDWPTAVRQVLRERQDTSEKYWREKKKKFELQKEKDPSVRIPTSHKPFFSADPRKLKRPCLFPVEIDGKSFLEFHFVQAFLERPKTILKDLGALNLSPLDHAPLNANYLTYYHGGAQTMAHVVPENFGKLLARLSHRVPKDGTLDFRGVCCLKGNFNEVRDMVVRLSKKSHDDLMVKVSLYMPHMVLGDTPHLKALPEELYGLSFLDFNIAGMPGMEQVDILCLDVGDRALARALAGQFVPDTPDLNFSSLMHALCWGGAHQMRKAASDLSVQGFEMLNGRAKELGNAIALAVHTRNIDVLEELIRSPLLEKLDAKTLGAMVRAEGPDELGGMGFSLAIQRGRADAVIAMGELLYRVKDRLPKGVAEEVLLIEDLWVGVSEDVVESYGNVIMAHGAVIKKCLGAHSPISMSSVSGIRGFLLSQSWQGKRFLLQGMNLPPHALNALLRGTQDGLKLSLKSGLISRVIGICNALELVIAVQNCGTKLEKSSASLLLKEIRFACQQPRFLCCGRGNSESSQEAIYLCPRIQELFKLAEDALKS